MEKESLRRSRNQQLKGVILQTVATAGVLSVALLAPNVLGAFKKLGLIKTPRQREIIRNSRLRLINNGLMTYDKSGYIHLTLKGENVLRRFEINEYKVKVPKRWDKKWRVIIFDVKENNRRTRDLLRKTLVNIGFIKLQQSVWVYPYDCEDLVTLLKADLKMGMSLLYLIVDSIENDKQLRIEFGLP